MLSKLCYPGVIKAGKSFFHYCELGQICSVAGSEDDCEQSPDVGQKSAGHSARVVDVDGRPEQHRPDQPERAEQREAML